MKDKDLNLLLSEYRSQQTSDLQLQKWKRAVRRETNVRGRSKKRLWIQLAAASIVGFIVGAIAFKTSDQSTLFQNLAQNNGDNATVEYVFTKTN